jgi:hypothetical protein
LCTFKCPNTEAYFLNKMITLNISIIISITYLWAIKLQYDRQCTIGPILSV